MTIQGPEKATDSPEITQLLHPPGSLTKDPRAGVFSDRRLWDDKSVYWTCIKGLLHASAAATK